MKAPLTWFTLVLSLLLAACEHDTWSGGLEIAAERFSGGAKVCIDGTSGTWVNGDQIRINGEVAEVVRSGDRAYLRNVEARSVNRAVYPATLLDGEIANDAVTVTLPSEYHYRVDADGHQLLAIPMAARSENDGLLQFHHLTGALCFILTDTSSQPLILESLEVKSNKYQQNGAFGIDFRQTDTIGARRSSTAACQTVTMLFHDDTLTPGTPLRVVVPVAAVGSDNRFTVTVRARHQGRVYKTIQNQGNGGDVDRSLSRNQLGYAAISVGKDPGLSENLSLVVGSEMQIRTTHDLLLMAEAISNEEWKLVNSNTKYADLPAVLMNDIDMQGDTLVSIKSYGKTFDGNGHTISNLVIKSRKVNNNTEYRCGLFAQGQGTLVKDLTLSNVTLVHNAASASLLYMGALCAKPADRESLSISNCTISIASVQAALITSTLNIGGIAGSANNNTTITSCSVSIQECEINQENRINWGGFIGSVGASKSANISSSHYNGVTKLTSTGPVYAGGAVGFLANGTVTLSNISIEGSIKAYVEENTNAKLGLYIGQKQNLANFTKSNSSSTIALYINNTQITDPQETGSK